MHLFFFSFLAMFSVISPHAKAGDGKTLDPLWSPTAVEWQVVKSKDKATLEDLCVIRWIYDESVYLSFLEKNDQFIFQILTKKNGNDAVVFPALSVGKDYYGVLIKRGGSLTQMSAHAFSDNTMSIILPKEEEAFEYFKSAEKISLFFKDTILNLPLTNAVENYTSYGECMGNLGDADPSNAEEFIANNELAPNLSENIPPLSLVERAAENLSSMPAGLTIPPRLPAYRLSKTKRSVMEQQKELEQSGNHKDINENLIKNLRLLEIEKEELRRKLLSITQESFIPDLVACEPGASGKSKDSLEVIKEGYEATIERLQVENMAIREQLTSSQ